MHYIYHIPERRKIGVTDNLERRMIKHKKTYKATFSGFYAVLEQHENAQTAGDREWELQDQYGYPRDKNHYTKTINMSVLGVAASVAKTRSLTMDDARDIRNKHIPLKRGDRRTGGISGLAKEYGVTRALIRSIINNNSYNE